jgi:hypothetical protein
MDIGKPQRIIEVEPEPLHSPVDPALEPEPQHAPIPVPAPAPAREPVPVRR